VVEAMVAVGMAVAMVEAMVAVGMAVEETGVGMAEGSPGSGW